MFRIKFAVLAGLVLSAGALALAGCGPGKESTQPGQATTKQIKDAKYDSIKIGMTRADAEKILSTGEEITQDQMRERLASLKSLRPDVNWEPLIARADWTEYEGDGASYLIGCTDDKVVVKHRQSKP